MEIKVLSRDDAEDALRDDKGIGNIKAMISIADSEPYTAKAPYGTAKVPKVLRLIFDDTVDPHSSWSPPNQAHIERIVNFARSLQDDSVEGVLLIHCEAGISRSAAAAVICLTTWWGPEREAEAIISTYADNHRAWPNTLMIRYADDVLGRNGTLLKAVKDNPDAELWVIDQEAARQSLETKRGNDEQS